MVEQIVQRANALGASLAGVVDVASLKRAPSYATFGLADWPAEAKSVLVVALAHPSSELELDWWDDEPLGTPGNRRLHLVAEGMQSWLKQEHNIVARPLPYQPTQGGVFLKDASALAGLGIIGRNNLLITPKYGPRVRLRALVLDVPLEPTGPIPLSPCTACGKPCWAACPQAAFESGTYEVTLCRLQMAADEAQAGNHHEGQDGLGLRQVIRYCRACELACPVGAS